MTDARPDTRHAALRAPAETAIRSPWLPPSIAIFVVWTLFALYASQTSQQAGLLRVPDAAGPVPVDASLPLYLVAAWQWALVFTPLVFVVTRRFPLDPHRWLRTIVAHGLTLAGVILLDPAGDIVNAALVGNLGWNWSRYDNQLRSGMQLNLALYCTCAFVSSTLLSRRALREREVRAARLEAELANARLAGLRAQFQPHFLFNALNTIASLLRRDVEAADRALTQLAGLMRHALEESATPEVPVASEMAWLERYLAIEQARFRDRLKVTTYVAPDARHAMVPQLVLQPLVENAIKHGISPRPGPGTLRIAVTRRKERLVLEVRDDGAGLGGRASAVEGYGLRNVRARLAQLYGATQAMTVGPHPDGGVVAIIELPFQSVQDGGEAAG